MTEQRRTRRLSAPGIAGRAHPPAPNSKCKHIFAALSAYLDGELRAGDCRKLEKHLHGCKPCLAYLESLKTTIEACGQYPVPNVPKPSPRVCAALLQALRKP